MDNVKSVGKSCKFHLINTWFYKNTNHDIQTRVVKTAYANVIVHLMVLTLREMKFEYSTHGSFAKLLKLDVSCLNFLTSLLQYLCSVLVLIEESGISLVK